MSIATLHLLHLQLPVASLGWKYNNDDSSIHCLIKMITQQGCSEYLNNSLKLGLTLHSVPKKAAKHYSNSYISQVTNYSHNRLPAV